MPSDELHAYTVLAFPFAVSAPPFGGTTFYNFYRAFYTPLTTGPKPGRIL
jgi:hypothetical protein